MQSSHIVEVSDLTWNCGKPSRSKYTKNARFQKGPRERSIRRLFICTPPQHQHLKFDLACFPSSAAAVRAKHWNQFWPEDSSRGRKSKLPAKHSCTHTSAPQQLIACPTTVFLRSNLSLPFPHHPQDQSVDSLTQVVWFFQYLPS